ncbi:MULTISPECIES: trypco2 family protein [unclassified Nocardiopsis]|uniref:trypco2 family protein n=1 Tax=unclassified Nocardiopsis TaxID=2649073 RepID=UPI001916AEE6|nr:MULTISPECIES: trypco2 family protein [unclassified Nocardiopsis]
MSSSIGLAEAIGRLRQELDTARKEGEGHEIGIEVVEAEVEFLLELHKEGSGKAGVNFGVVSAGADGRVGAHGVEDPRADHGADRRAEQGEGEVHLPGVGEVTGDRQDELAGHRGESVSMAGARPTPTSPSAEIRLRTQPMNPSYSSWDVGVIVLSEGTDRTAGIMGALHGSRNPWRGREKAAAETPRVGVHGKITELLLFPSTGGTPAPLPATTGVPAAVSPPRDVAVEACFS